MPTVSLCMIVKNEEEVLARCLESIADLVDEIILVDTGSTDRTKEIAADFTCKVFDFQWIDDFAAARNFSFSKAEMEYCMWLDADDVLGDSERNGFLQMKKSLPKEADIVMMKYHTAFDDRGAPTFSYFRERWIKNDSTHKWIGAVHEVITPEGSIIYSDIGVSHKKLKSGDPDRNLKIYEKLLADQCSLEPRQQYYYGRELYYHEQFEKSVSVLTNFINTTDGWVENKIEACALCTKCYEKMNMQCQSLPILFRSFELDLPRAEICCDIGKYFIERTDYRIAAYWYEAALTVKRNDRAGGFILPDCYDYVPYLQLCVCCDKLGDKVMAQEYNEKAGKCKPDSSAYLYNKRYFETLKNV